MFFASYGLTVGWLVFRSTFLPRILGILLIAGALCNLVFGFADILTHRFASLLVPWIQLPSFVGELSFTLWLLIAGVNGERWAVARDQVDPRAARA